MKKYSLAAAFLLGIIVGYLTIGSLIKATTDTSFSNLSEGKKHDEEVHVHADWLVVVHDEVIRFTDNKYQSTGAHSLHPSIHLHDGDDLVIHRHAEGVTFLDFFRSLGYDLNENCLITDSEESFCNEGNKKVLLFVNREVKEEIDSYIIEEEDQILLYYGIVDGDKIDDYLDMISDNSCLYSGTCLERGYATTSSCGLTCEDEE